MITKQRGRQHLGAPTGPVLRSVAGEASAHGTISQRVRRLPAQRWSPGADPRRGLIDDSWSDDLAWLVDQWPTLTEQDRRRRAKALWGAIEGDWTRLRGRAQTSLVYFYYNWRFDDLVTAPASWLALLRTIEWVAAADGSLKAPPDLIRNTASNRLAIGGDEGQILLHANREPDLLDALGVRARPDVRDVLETLRQLRKSDDGANPTALLRPAAACYDLIAAELLALGADARRDLVVNVVRPKMQGNSRAGLIYAPPPQGLAGKRWWPPSRTIRGDVAKIAGPFLGQLAGRYPRATALWDALGLSPRLTPESITEVISNELAGRTLDDPTTSFFYGELIAELQRQSLPADRAPSIPALSDLGWATATAVRRTSRPELRTSLRGHVPFWAPGEFDPSLLSRAAEWLGIRDLSATSEVEEQWTINSGEVLAEPVEAGWRAAISRWPDLLRAAGGWSDEELAALREATDGIRPAVARDLHALFTLGGADGATLVVEAEPDAVLRETVLVARSEDALFSSAAAQAMSSLVAWRQLAASHSLLSLLDDARERDGAADDGSRPPGFAFATPAFVLVAEDGDTSIDDALKKLAQAPAPSTLAKVDKVTRPPRRERVFADPTDFELAGIERIESVAPPDEAAAPTGRGSKGPRPPKAEDRKPLDRPGDARPIPPNTAVEDAARPYVEAFELARGGYVTHRQGPLVGADFVSIDGRYIEVKATGGTASDAFDLETSEWQAALNPAIRDNYWVYVVEHLDDGEVPTVYAIFNPVRDVRVGHHPVGKMRVSGWRSAAVIDSGRWRRRPS